MKVKRTILFVTLLTLLLCSCGQKEKDASDSSWYVPADEWQGAETVAYSREYADFVAANPHGSPDPVPDADGEQQAFDPASIVFRTKQEQYSISGQSSVAFEITYRGEAGSKVIWRQYFSNLERWNGETWERLIDVNYFTIPTTTQYMEKVSLHAGDTTEGTFFLDDVITRLTPGKYRLVIYIDDTPVYAEFELTA